eukprot:4970335-Pleurochrysis_carterae.AAC.8
MPGVGHSSEIRYAFDRAQPPDMKSTEFYHGHQLFQRKSQNTGSWLVPLQRSHIHPHAARLEKGVNCPHCLYRVNCGVHKVTSGKHVPILLSSARSKTRVAWSIGQSGVI